MKTLGAVFSVNTGRRLRWAGVAVFLTWGMFFFVVTLINSCSSPRCEHQNVGIAVLKDAFGSRPCLLETSQHNSYVV